MHACSAPLVHGGKAPYDTWTFALVPDTVVEAWGRRGPIPVRGTLAGAPFRGTVARGEGAWRMPVTRPLRDATGVAVGDVVELRIEVDPEPRPIDIPAELQDTLDGDPELAAAFERLASSCRRAWAQHVAEAKRPATRRRRAEKAAQGIPKRLFPGQKA